MTYELIVIGAGINGAGIARDAAIRGLKVLLVDKGDLASGTTSWSSRLIHGGLRYLEYGEIGLVRESLRERDILLRIAPHLVRPIPILIPIFKNNSRGRLEVRVGLSAYDLLGYDSSLSKHRMLSAKDVQSISPDLSRAKLVGGALYFDGQAEFPERIVVENAVSAAAAGAKIRTYSRVTQVVSEGGKVCGVEIEDLLDGTTHQFPANAIANASGPWVDGVLRTAGSDSSAEIGGTKGTHIVIERPTRAPATAVYAESKADQRPFFVIPWNNRILIGTTDERYAGSPDAAMPTESEIDYLLSETSQLFPSWQLSRDAVLFAYAGIRPLPMVNSGKTGKITRRHFIRKHSINGLFSVIGGKLTTYRNLSREVVDQVFRYLDLPLVKCETDKVNLPGAQNLSEGPNRKAPEWMKTEVRERLSRIYGTRSAQIESLVESNSELARALGGSEVLSAELVFAFRFEFARTLSDFVIRRAMAGYSGTNLMEIAQASAECAVRNLGWNESRAESEKANLLAFGRKLGIKD